MSLLKRKNKKLLTSFSNKIIEDKLFNPAFSLSVLKDFWNGESKIPLANIIETDQEYRVDLSAPGMDGKDFKVEIEDGSLFISAEKDQESKEDKKNYKSREFSYSSFFRSFPLPENIYDDKINAKYENGMLKVVIPKKKINSAKTRKAIKVA